MPKFLVFLLSLMNHWRDSKMQEQWTGIFNVSELITRWIESADKENADIANVHWKCATSAWSLFLISNYTDTQTHTQETITKVLQDVCVFIQNQMRNAILQLLLCGLLGWRCTAIWNWWMKNRSLQSGALSIASSVSDCNVCTYSWYLIMLDVMQVLSDIDIPAEVQHMFQAIPENLFYSDLSSTALRQKTRW